MKKVFTASKGSYGTEFFDIKDSIDELKKAIVYHELQFSDNEYTDDKYTEELFIEARADGEYTLYEVDLHPDEEIQFDGYDGQSWFTIEKIDKGILSRSRPIEE
jgi:NAD(P)H-flavin reductase